MEPTDPSDDLADFGNLSQLSDISLSPPDAHSHAPDAQDIHADKDVPHAKYVPDTNPRHSSSHLDTDAVMPSGPDGTRVTKRASVSGKPRVSSRTKHSSGASERANRYSHLVVFTAHKAGMNSKKSKVDSDQVNRVRFKIVLPATVLSMTGM